MAAILSWPQCVNIQGARIFYKIWYTIWTVSAQTYPKPLIPKEKKILSNLVSSTVSADSLIPTSCKGVLGSTTDFPCYGSCHGLITVCQSTAWKPSVIKQLVCKNDIAESAFVTFCLTLCIFTHMLMTSLDVDMLYYFPFVLFSHLK